MVDVDRRAPGLTPAHVAGLRRLSARAAAVTTTSTSSASTSGQSRKSLLSFESLAESVLNHLRNSGVTVLEGLSDAEFARLEAEFHFIFPPDLRAILSSGVPVGIGFPEWRFKDRLRCAIELPLASVTLQIARSAFWPKSWGMRPSDPDRALAVARNNLKKAPLLIPLFDHCYIPASPQLAGNPVFYVDENQICCCGYDLSDFFESQFDFRSGGMNKHSSTPRFGLSITRRSVGSGVNPPRRIDFWTEAAVRRQRNLNQSERFYEISNRPNPPPWVGEYLERMGSILREGGWDESEVKEMCDAPSQVNDSILIDDGAIQDLLLLRTDRFSGELIRGGWSSEEVSETLGLHIVAERKRRQGKPLPPALMEKIEKLASCLL